MQRTQFTFYDSFYRAIARIKSKASRCDAYDALCRYALQGQEPELDTMPDAAAIAFELMRPNLDASRRKAESGSRGGSIKRTESKPEANCKEPESKNKDKGKNKNKIENKDKCHSVFMPPTVPEVEAYCLERGNGVDPRRFVDYYSANGWKVGKNPMKDWKAAVRTWERREDESPQRQAKTKSSNPFLDMLEEGGYE